MLTELTRLSRTIDFLSTEQAQQIVSVVNDQLASKLNAHIVDVLWKEEARDEVILRPFTGIDRTARGGLKSYSVNEHTKGIWAWLYRNRKPVWIEQTQDKGSAQIRNEATNDLLDAEELDVYQESQSILAVPLVFRDTVWGIYSIELPISGKLSLDILELLNRIAMPLSTIIWKADAQKLNHSQTSEAIREFAEIVRDQDIPLNPYRTGFIARPFRPEFDPVEDCIGKYLRQREVKAESYIHTPGLHIVITGIMERIRESHFGIVDITALNPNVMLELGMLMEVNKRILLLRQHKDETVIPFDLRPHQLYGYQVLSGSQMKLWNVSQNQFEPIERVLDQFMDTLMRDAAFGGARPWRGSA